MSSTAKVLTTLVRTKMGQSIVCGYNHWRMHIPQCAWTCGDHRAHQRPRVFVRDTLGERLHVYHCRAHGKVLRFVW